MAAWGQPPVSTAIILSSLSALCRTKNSASSLVNMSFVTAQRLYFSLNFRHAANMKAVCNKKNDVEKKEDRKEEIEESKR
jgi:hypothetical protein